METSNVAVATNGIVPLSSFEIDLVSGGKSVVQKIWESISSWFDGLSGPPNVSSPIPATADQINQLMNDCLNSGGDFSLSTGTATTGLSFNVVGVDGSVSWFNLQCTRP